MKISVNGLKNDIGKGSPMGWTRAYNFNLGRRVTITETIELRNKYGRKDPRAGDLHCHEDCYAKKTGSRLTSRKESIDKKTGKIKKIACFAKWPSKYTQTDSYCGIESKAISKRESMDYAEYYFMMEEYLNQLSLDCEPFFIKEVILLDSLNRFDFTIVHSNSNKIGIKKSNIVIIDENKRRMKLFGESNINGDEFDIVIRISEFTPEQLIDFQKSGVEKLRLEWDYLQSLLLQERSDDADEEKISVEVFDQSERDYLEVILSAKSKIVESQVRLQESWISEFQSLVDDLENGLDNNDEKEYEKLMEVFSSFIQSFCSTFGYTKLEIQNEEFPFEYWARIKPKPVKYSKQIRYSREGESERLIRYLEENHDDIDLHSWQYEGKKDVSLPFLQSKSQSKISKLFSRLNNVRRTLLPKVKPDIFNKYVDEIKKLGDDLKLPTFDDRHSIKFKEWQGDRKTLSWDELSDGQKVYEELGLKQNSRKKDESRKRILTLQRCIHADD